jgi:hypothetical protein
MTENECREGSIKWILWKWEKNALIASSALGRGILGVKLGIIKIFSKIFLKILMMDKKLRKKIDNF